MVERATEPELGERQNHSGDHDGRGTHSTEAAPGNVILLPFGHILISDPSLLAFSSLKFLTKAI